MRGASGFAVDEASRDIDHAATGVHQAVADRRDLVGMTGAAGFCRIAEQPRKARHAGMRSISRRALIIAAMAKRAAVCGESVRRGKTCTFGSMAIVASVTFYALRGQQGESQKAEKNQGSASHIEIVIVLMLL